jgi:protein-disulfide isomerase
MKFRYLVWLLIAGLLAAAAPCAAEVEWRVEKELKLDAAPVDLATSASGQWLFVLTAGGKVAVFSSQGDLNDEFEVAPGVDGLATGPQEEILYLTNSKAGSVQIVLVDFIRDINVAGSPLKGPADAPVSIVVFTDFQCPYCARTATQLDQILAKNPDTVNLIFKNFPLRSHNFALKAATAALAAGKMGKFWEFHDLLFQNYNRLNDEKITEIAATLQLDQDEFSRHLKDPTITGQIRRDFQDGVEAGVRGTPSLFVNGKQLRDRSPNGFQAAIDEALAKSDKGGKAAVSE